LHGVPAKRAGGPLRWLETAAQVITTAFSLQASVAVAPREPAPSPQTIPHVSHSLAPDSLTPPPSPSVPSKLRFTWICACLSLHPLLGPPAHTSRLKRRKGCSPAPSVRPYYVRLKCVHVWQRTVACETASESCIRARDGKRSAASQSRNYCAEWRSHPRASQELSGVQLYCRKTLQTPQFSRSLPCCRLSL